MWKILLGPRVTDVPCHISHCMLEVRWFSAQQFDTFYRMLEQTFFAYFDFSI